MNTKWTLVRRPSLRPRHPDLLGQPLRQRRGRHECPTVGSCDSRAGARPRPSLPAGRQEQLRAPRERRVRADSPAGCSGAATGSSTTSGSPTAAATRIGDAFGGVPGYVGDFYDNSRFDAHDDVPVMSMDDIFPAPASVAVGHLPDQHRRPARATSTIPPDIRYLDTILGAPRLTTTGSCWPPRSSSARKTAVSLFYTGSRGRELPYLPEHQHPRVPDGLALGGRVQRRAAQQQRPLRRRARAAPRPDVDVQRGDDPDRPPAVGWLAVPRATTRTRRRSPTADALDGAIDEPTQTWDWNRQLGRGEARFSHPHRLVAAAPGTCRSASSLKGLARGLLHGWRLSGVYTFESGDALDGPQQPEQRAGLRARHAQRRSAIPTTARRPPMSSSIPPRSPIPART